MLKHKLCCVHQASHCPSLPRPRVINTRLSLTTSEIILSEMGLNLWNSLPRTILLLGIACKLASSLYHIGVLGVHMVVLDDLKCLMSWLQKLVFLVNVFFGVGPLIRLFWFEFPFMIPLCWSITLPGFGCASFWLIFFICAIRSRVA